MRTTSFIFISLASFALAAAACSGSNDSAEGPTTGTVHKDSGVDEVAIDDTGVDETDDETLPDAVDVFADQPAYVPHTGSSISRKAQHAFHIPSLTDYSKSDCGTAGCHDGTAASDEAFNMLFGGTVYWLDDGTPARGVEVRLVDATGHGYSVYSDVDGVFYARLPTGMTSAAAAWPAHTGARAGGDQELMSTEVKQVGCNAKNCHDGTDAYPVILVPRPAP